MLLALGALHAQIRSDTEHMADITMHIAACILQQCWLLALPLLHVRQHHNSAK